MSWYAIDPDDVLDDPGFLRLSPPAFGLALLLVFRGLKRGHMIDDPAVYRLLWGNRFPDFDTAWKEVRECFQVDPDGLLYLPWIDDSREDTSARLKSTRERVRKHRQQERENEACNAVRNGVRNSRQTDRQTDNPDADRADARKSPSGPCSSPISRPRKTPTGDHPECIQHWESEWARTGHGQRYVVSAADGAAVAWMLRQSDAPETRRRMTALLEDRDSWMFTNASMPLLRSKWNRFESPAKRTSDDQLARYPQIGGRP